MKTEPRIYDSFLKEQLASEYQMAFVSGPRQVGKTTVCRNHATVVLNWDHLDDREIILEGPGRVAKHCGLDDLRKAPPVILFDELHKYPGWKQFLKGFYDRHAKEARILVTGSSRLDTYRRVGDSLMGRYFLYHMHPFSVGELLRTSLPDIGRVLHDPAPIAGDVFEALWIHGGYPQPFLRADTRFSNRWNVLRKQQLLREDVRDLTQIQQVDQLEMLATLLASRSGEQLVYSSIAKSIRVSVDTARRWVDTLCGLHYGFLVRPWHRNVTKSLRKEPKWFLRDWSEIRDPGQRVETFIACHLFKAVEGWNDLGLGRFQLAYLRDTQKREVDFIVVRDDEPWFLVEAKKGKTQISPSLSYFQKQLGLPFAFQVVLDFPYVDADCFQVKGRPQSVPAKTFLAQLL